MGELSVNCFKNSKENSGVTFNLISLADGESLDASEVSKIPRPGEGVDGLQISRRLIFQNRRCHWVDLDQLDQIFQGWFSLSKAISVPLN